MISGRRDSNLPPHRSENGRGGFVLNGATDQNGRAVFRNFVDWVAIRSNRLAEFSNSLVDAVFAKVQPPGMGRRYALTWASSAPAVSGPAASDTPQAKAPRHTKFFSSTTSRGTGSVEYRASGPTFDTCRARAHNWGDGPRRGRGSHCGFRPGVGHCAVDERRSGGHCVRLALDPRRADNRPGKAPLTSAAEFNGDVTTSTSAVSA